MAQQFRSSLLILVIMLLTACGFSLRGSNLEQVILPPQFQTLRVESDAGNTDMLRKLRRTLSNNGVTIVDNSNDDSYLLTISREQLLERVLSLNSNARAGEFELTMSLPIQLLTKEHEDLFNDEVLMVSKVYLADPNNAIAKAEEAELIHGEMRQDLAQQILRRLQTASE